MHKSRMPALPQHESPKDRADQFMDFFISKITKIKATLQNSTSNRDYLPTLPVCPVSVKLSEFELVSTETVAKLVRSSKSKTCPLDPLPTNLVKECIDVLAPTDQQIIILSLSSAVVPGRWKAALISPILKKPGLDVARENFRPISNLEFVGKLCEKVVSAQLVKHVNDNNLNDVFQSAYKAGHSTETALARVLNDMLRSIDERRVTILVLLDLSAAFDTVVYDILLHRLCHRFGVTGRALDWFRSYLTSRSERVTVNGTCSQEHIITCGVPQGSVLGLILFLAYVSPLGDVIRKYGLDFHFFADDSQIYLSFESGDPLKQEIAFETINCAISDTRSWMAANFMMMNDDKTELAIFGNRQQLNKLEHPLSIISGEELFFPSEKIRNLGVIVDPCLRLHLHINNIIRVCMFHLRNIAKIPKFLTFDACQAVVHAFVSHALTTAMLFSTVCPPASSIACN